MMSGQQTDLTYVPMLIFHPGLISEGTSSMNNILVRGYQFQKVQTLIH